MAEIKTYRDFSLGVNLEFDPRRMPTTRTSQRSVSHAVNLDFNEDGTISSRFRKIGVRRPNVYNYAYDNPVPYKGGSLSAYVSYSARGSLVYRANITVVYTDYSEYTRTVAEFDVLSISSPTDEIFLSCTEHNGELYISTAEIVVRRGDYASTNVIKGFIFDGANLRVWGASPVDMSLISVFETPGDRFEPGNYQLTLTRVTDGVESPPADIIYRRNTTQCDLEFDLGEFMAANDNVKDTDELRFYISRPNSSSLYMYMALHRVDIDGGQAPTYEVSYSLNESQLTTIGTMQPPSSTAITSHNAVIYMAQDNVLWATLPDNPHLIDAAVGFYQLPHKITGVFSSGRGLYIEAGGAYYLRLPETEEATLHKLCEENVVTGSMHKTPSGKVLWYTNFGFYTGDDNGEAEPITKGNFQLEMIPPVKAASFVKDGQEILAYSRADVKTPTSLIVTRQFA